MNEIVHRKVLGDPVSQEAERGYALLYVWCKPDLVPWYERQEFSTDVPEHILAYVPDGRRVLGVLTVLPEQET
jgi:hypothetical protein